MQMKYKPFFAVALIKIFILAVRVGHLRLKVQFSSELPLDLTCLMHSESPATLYLNMKQNKVTGSYI